MYNPAFPTFTRWYTGRSDPGIYYLGSMTPKPTAPIVVRAETLTNFLNIVD